MTFTSLHEQHEDKYHSGNHEQVVRLSEEYGGRWSIVSELLMKQYSDQIELIRFSSDSGEPVQVFKMTGEELDALVEARAAFKQSIVDFDAATEARIAQEIEQAKELLASVCGDHDLSWSLQELEPGIYALVDERTSVKLADRLRSYNVLTSIKNYLVQKKLIAPEPQKSTGDDFDPFLDSDDLP